MFADDVVLCLNSDMKRKIIYLHGNLGAGKSSTADGLAERFGYGRHSTGKIFRDYSKEKDMNVKELSELAEKDNSIDYELDRIQKEFLEEHDGVVMDGRLGFYLVPEAFNVFLKLDEETAAERIVADVVRKNPDRSVEDAYTKEEMLERIRHRQKSEAKRYLELYGIRNHFDPDHFDLIVDTKENNLEEVIDIIAREYEKWLLE